MRTTIQGLAHHVPPETPRNGVTRPIVVDPKGASDLVLEPARQAAARAGTEIEDLDFLIFATMTPDVTFPGSACYLQDKIGAATVGALDVRAQCAGFLVGLHLADAFLSAGVYRRILLATSEIHSSGLDYGENGRQIAALYGDAAAAIVLGRNEGAAGLLAVTCHTDGRDYDRFWCEFPSSRQHPHRITAEDVEAGRHYPRLDFDFTLRFGREKLPQVVSEVLTQGGTTSDDVDCFFLSHILPEVVDASAKSLGIPPDRLVDAGAPHGHLTSATLPVALSEAVEAGRLGSGARVCLATCGAGAAWGAALVTL